MVRPLHRKLLRDLWHAKGQAFAIGLLVAIASAAYLGSTWTYQSLLETQRAYYERYRFPHVFASLRRAPQGLVERVRAIPGVAQAEARVVASASLELPGFDEPATATVVSIPAGAQPDLNRLHLRTGRLPAADDEALVSEGFAEVHRLVPGDELEKVISGNRETVRVVGIALSPEFTYAIRPGDLMPDDAHFGVFWMTRDGLEAAFDMEGAFNDLSVRLSPGAVEEEVIAAIDRLLEPYGGLDAHGRDRQVSHRFLSEEITQLRATAIAVPSIFLGVAAFLLSVVLSRLIGTQRQQIGTLKALGRGNLEIGLHYASFVGLIVLAGLIGGLVLGFLMGSAFTRLYVQYYRFPFLVLETGLGALFVAALLAFGAAALGVGGSVRRAVKLAPAEAMRPEPPASFKPTVLERIGLGRLVSVPGRMVLRSLERRPLRSALTVLGIAAGVAVVVAGGYSGDALISLVEFQFGMVQREDLAVTFVDPEPIGALYEIEALPGVHQAEPFRAVPTVLRSGHLTYRTPLTGMAPQASLRRVVNDDGTVVTLPPEGVILSRQLARILEVEPGDALTVEVLEGERPTRTVRVAGLVDDLVGVSAYMRLDALNALLGEGRVISGAWLEVDPTAEWQLFERLRERPGVAGVTLRSAALESFRRTMDENLGVFTAVLNLLAAIIAAGVVYNAARVALAERERELATLRVIGYTRPEVFRIVVEELAVQVLLAIPIGFAIGRAFALALSAALTSDLFRLPAVLHRASYVTAALVVLISAAAVAGIVWRWMTRLELVSVLKTGE